MRDISRRNFLKYIGAGTLGFITLPKIPFAGRKAGLAASNVVQCFHEQATSGSTIDESVVQMMMDASIKALTGINDTGEAWKSIFPGITENSIISIKVNTIYNLLPTHAQLVNCMVNGLTRMSFGGTHYRRNNVIVWDRDESELRYAGYDIYTGDDPDTVRCFGTDRSGYDYSYSLETAGHTVHPSKILSQMTDYLINAAVLKNHSDAQVTGTMKNHYGSVDDRSHRNHCNPGIPSLNQQIRDEISPHNIQKICIIDALWGSITNGPGGPPNCTPNKLIMSLDTVACDYQGWNLINEERQKHGYGTISWPVYHIEAAAESPYNLGTTDINLITISNPTDVEEARGVRSVDSALSVSPNPFRTRTTITFSLPRASSVHLDLIDSAGRVAASIYSGRLSRGTHRMDYLLNKRLPSSTYFLRFSNEGKTHIQKVTILN
jgi:hypothetical protein